MSVISGIYLLLAAVGAIVPFRHFLIWFDANGVSITGLIEAWTVNAAAEGMLYDLADRLRARGWQVPAYSMPPNRKDLVVQRILVRNGVSRDLAELLLDDFRWALEHLDSHPIAKSLSEEDAGGFSH